MFDILTLRAFSRSFYPKRQINQYICQKKRVGLYSNSNQANRRFGHPFLFVNTITVVVLISINTIHTAQHLCATTVCALRLTHTQIQRLVEAFRMAYIKGIDILFIPHGLLASV